MPFAPVRDDDPDLQALIGGDAPAAPAAAARPAANGAVADDDPDLQALLNGPSKSSGPIMPEIGKPVEGGTQEPINGATAAAYAVSNIIPFDEDFGAAVQAGETYLPTWANTDHIQEPDNATFSQRFANERRKIAQTEKALSLVYPRTMSWGPIAGSIAAMPVVGPADALAAGATRLVPGLGGLAADAIGSAAVGAGYGAAYGASDGDTIADRVQNAVHGAGCVADGAGRATGLAQLQRRHRQHRSAELGVTAGWRRGDDPGGTAGRPHQAHSGAVGQHRIGYYWVCATSPPSPPRLLHWMTPHAKFKEEWGKAYTKAGVLSVGLSRMHVR